MTHWTERLFKEQSDQCVEFFERRFGAADAQVDAIIDLVATEYDAEGLDFSEPFVERAREYARERGVADRTTLREHDLREIDEVTGSYDLVTSFWNSLGYYDRATDERMLANARRLLTEDGVLVVEASNRDFYLANLERSSVSEDEVLFVERREYDPQTGRFHTQLDRFEVTEEGYDHEYSMEWENRIYAPVTLRELCEDAGFADVRLLGGFDGSAVTMDSDTVVVLAR